MSTVIDGIFGIATPSLSTNSLVANSYTGNISNTLVTATGTLSARSLASRFADVINVKDFGAVGDGVTNDTAAIQAAINSVSPFGTVFIPEGVYRVTNTLIVPNFPSTTISGVNFIGEGDGSVLKLTTSTTLLSCNGDTVSFEKLGFDGQTATPNTGIVFEGANNNQNVTVKDCYFAGWDNAVLLYTDAWTIHNNRFTNCLISINCANWAMNGSCANNYTLGGITSIALGKDKTRTSAFSLTGGQQPEGVRIYDNCFLNTGNLARPIVIRAGLEISIFNNIIDQVGLSGIGIFAVPITDPDTTYSISHIKIRDNWINCGGTNRGVCMQVVSADTMWIDSNTFNTPDGQGLALTLNTVNTYWVTNNTFLGTGTIGFSGTPFITVNSARGNIYGNMNRFGALSAFETNNFTNSFVVNNVPTLSAGLPSGSIWRDAAAGNVLKIVP